MSALSYRTETVIRRPPQDVFDYCSDLRSELQWNPKVNYVEKLTDGPVRVGTRYRARWANSGPTAVEVVQFDRPRKLGDQDHGTRHEHPVPRHRHRRRPRGTLHRTAGAPTPGAWPDWLRPLP